MLSQPKGQLAPLLQGIWSASVCSAQAEPVSRALYSDAGSGVLFHLTGEVSIGDHKLPHGVIALPISKVSQRVTLMPGAQLAGLRFHPAISYGVFGQHVHAPSLLTGSMGRLDNLDGLFQAVKKQSSHQDRINEITHWAEQMLQHSQILPHSLSQALAEVDLHASQAELNEHIPLSQRQIERLFKRWLQISPKQYQRIRRVKQAIEYLRAHREVCLADVSQQFGFSDQAHMTREFRAIAATTPAKV
ncbi:helix-turn-helix domain-containing protein [Motilimonas sp. KMU-193]|uniref:AraC family transcriptional regulator n=1 Tax=Motilimonas sp. KMU-193 TaxID=3388668 RepID=UPI00396B0DAB